MLRRTAPRFVLTLQELEEAPAPRMARWAILLGTAFLGGFLVWSSYFQISERAFAQGEIMPDGFVQPVQHPDGGMVAALLVRAGDRVAAGQALLRLDGSAARAEAEAARAREAALSLAGARLSAAAEGRVAEIGPASDEALAAIRDSQLAMAEATSRLRLAQLAVLDAELAGREAAVDGLLAQLPPMRGSRDLARQEVAEMGVMFDRGLARRSEIHMLRQTYLRSETDLARTGGELAAARLAALETQARRDELAARARQEALGELVRVEAELAEARQTRMRAEARLARLEVVAPVAGLVKELSPRGTGSVVEPGGLIAEIVPQEGAVLADVEVPADRVGGIRTGLRAQVKALTYDATRFGSVPGVVEHVSAASFRRPDGAAFFRLRVALEREHVGDARLGLALSPGMTVIAEITTAERSLLSWLAKPMRHVMGSAFAER
jgi:HlyD family type I secretion membrane fusion protein